MTVTESAAPTAVGDAELSARLIEAARDLVPRLRERSAETERLRRLPRETLEDVAGAGLLGILTPKVWGGKELGIETMARVTYELARGDASVAWCTMFLGAHDWLIAHFREEAQAEYWSNPAVHSAGIFAPSGRAEKVDGGYRVSGTWEFGSGIDHADWFLGGAIVTNIDEPGLHFFMFETGQFSYADDWRNLGLRGSCSATVTVDDVFVPEHRVIPVGWAAGGDGADGNPDPLPNPVYSLPFPPVNSTLIGMVMLGTVQGAYEQLLEWVQSRVSSTTGRSVRDRVQTQTRVTEAAGAIQAARLLLESNLATICGAVSLDYRQRVVCRRDMVYASRLMVQAIEALKTVAGARGLQDASRFQKLWRDMHTMSNHILFEFDGTGERFGRMELGMEPPAPQIDPYY